YAEPAVFRFLFAQKSGLRCQLLSLVLDYEPFTTSFKGRTKVVEYFN
ncbi:MAG: hypothetical protein ACI9CU_001630, partial [Polaribacter sp.]